MTRLIQPLNLLPLSWGKTICVGRGSDHGCRGRKAKGSLRFSRRLWGSSKMSCV